MSINAVSYSMKKIFIYGEENTFVNYKNALEKVGAKAIISTDIQKARDCDGLLLAGGGDVSPCFYSAKEKNCRSVDLVRDVNEQYLIALFERRNTPIMGVCRGLQILNVYFSGTLAQSIEKKHLHYNEKHDVFHPIINSGFMRDVLGKNIIVNSCHRQQTDVSGKRLRALSVSPDGVIEGLYLPRSRIFGVQFHPERPFENGNADGIKLYEYFLTLTDRTID